MEFAKTIEDKTKTMSKKDWAKVGLKAFGVIAAIDVAKDIGNKTTPFTGAVCGIAIGDMMVRSADGIVDSLAAAKEKLFGPGFVTKISGEYPKDKEAVDGISESDYNISELAEE